VTQPANWGAVLATWTAGPAPYWLISNVQEQLIDLEESLDYAAALLADQPTTDIDIDDEDIDL
jgi:hypothetical protein